MPHSTSSSSGFTVTPIKPRPNSNVKFGAIVTRVDLNDVDDELFETLKTAIYTNQLIIVKGQQNLKPINHFNFVHRVDPDAQPIHGHGTLETVRTKWKGESTLLAFDIMRRMVKPENILLAEFEEGDIAIWNNRGTRTMHQVNIAASFPPS